MSINKKPPNPLGNWWRKPKRSDLVKKTFWLMFSRKNQKVGLWEELKNQTVGQELCD